mgnify:CR=1 FL=1
MNRILITTGIFPPDIGGPASYARTLATALANKGVDVCVLTYSQSFKPKFPKYNFKVVSVWGKWPIWIKHFIFGLKALRLLPKRDLVYSLNVWSAGLPSLISAKIYKKRFILKIVGDYAWEVGVGKGKISLLLDDFQKSKKHGWTGLLYKFQSLICRRADIVIVPSKYLAGIVSGWDVAESKIKVIYNGTDFKPLGFSREEARKKIGIPGSIILSVGRLVTWKGFRMLIKIMPQLLNANQFTRLIIVGEGPDRKILSSMIKNLGLDKKVFLVGKKSKDEMAVYLAASDIFVLNSGYEGFSHQILEAMACGVPVIASAVGGNKEIITQGDNGFLVRYNDEFNLIEAIKTIWQNPEFKEGLAESGKETTERFSAEKMIDETLKVLNPQGI